MQLSAQSIGRPLLSRSPVLILLLLPAVALAGTYELVISKTSEPTCEASAPDPSHYSAMEVVADPDRCFSGKPTEIRILTAAFQNARIRFSSTAARESIEQALVAWVTRGPRDGRREAARTSTCRRPRRP